MGKRQLIGCILDAYDRVKDQPSNVAQALYIAAAKASYSS
jgi:hypothetical protein